MQHIKRRSVTCACILLHDSFIFPIAFTPSSPTGSVADWFGCWFVGSSRGGPAARLGFDSQPPLRLFPGVLRVLGGLAAYSGVRGEPFCFALLSVLRFLSSDFVDCVPLLPSKATLFTSRFLSPPKRRQMLPVNILHQVWSSRRIYYIHMPIKHAARERWTDFLYSVTRSAERLLCHMNGPCGATTFHK